MRSLVTGGAGFIGSHLVDRLLRDGHEVIVVDNLSTGRVENLAHVVGDPRLSVEEVDIRDSAAIDRCFEAVNWVFHLAGLADIVPSMKHPLKYFGSNVLGTVSVLEAARRYQVERFVYVASGSCYGLPDVFPTPESAEIRPEYPYALTKYLGELCVLHWGKVYNLPVVSLRFSNVYGPRSRTSGAYGAVFGVFMAQKLHSRPLTVVGDGTQTRDFVFVTDAVNALVIAAESSLMGEVLNVGSGKTHSVNSIVELLGGDVAFVPKRPGEPHCTFMDIERIRRLLDWEPKVPFEEGVQIMLDNIEYWRGAPVWTPETIREATKDWFECLSQGDPVRAR